MYNVNDFPIDHIDAFDWNTITDDNNSMQTIFQTIFQIITSELTS